MGSMPLKMLLIGVLSIGCCQLQKPQYEGRWRVVDSLSELPPPVLDQFRDWRHSRHSDGIGTVRLVSGEPASHWRGDLRFVDSPERVTVPCPEAFTLVLQGRDLSSEPLPVKVSMTFAELFVVDGVLFDGLELFEFQVGHVTEGGSYFATRLIALDGSDEIRGDWFNTGKFYLGK